MAKEAIDAILQTEEEAKKRIREARSEAQESLDAGRVAMREEADQILRSAKAEAEELLHNTEENARRTQDEPLAEASQKANSLKSQDIKHWEPIVSRVVDEVLHYGDR